MDKSQRIMGWISFIVVNGLLALAGWRVIQTGQPFDKTLATIIIMIIGANLGAFSLKSVFEKWLK